MNERNYRNLVLILALTGFVLSLSIPPLAFSGIFPPIFYYIWFSLWGLGALITLVSLFMPRPEQYRVSGIIARVFNYLAIILYLLVFLGCIFFVG